MMGHRQKLVCGIEYDVLYERRRYCYLQNRHRLIAWVKRKLRRRERMQAKQQLHGGNHEMDFAGARAAPEPRGR